MVIEMTHDMKLKNCYIIGGVILVGLWILYILELRKLLCWGDALFVVFILITGAYIICLSHRIRTDDSIG